MIPAMNIIAWGQKVPWAEQRQVEQDLIISRAIVELFKDPLLREELRFRGGTALNKLHFSEPLRYSEDIDLVRTAAGPIGPVVNRIREILEPWLGRAAFDQSPVAPKLKFKVAAEDTTSPAPIRLKVEINTRERIALDPPLSLPLRIENPWFSGEASITTFSIEEMLATKLRALLQRNKGRDLVDLSHSLSVFQNLNTARTVECFSQYLAQSGLQISRAEAERRMFAKLEAPAFLADVRPLLAAKEAERFDDQAGMAAFDAVFTRFIRQIPGEPWARTEEMLARYGLTGA